MSKEEILQVLKNIYSGSNLFEVMEVDTEQKIFTLRNWNKCNMFFKYEIDNAQETITVSSLVGYFKRTHFISTLSKEQVMLC